MSTGGLYDGRILEGTYDWADCESLNSKKYRKGHKKLKQIRS
jgi:hypothetical protein